MHALLSCDCQQLGHVIYVKLVDSKSCNLFLTVSRWLRRPRICSTSSSSDEAQAEMPRVSVNDTVDGRNPANQLTWRIYHYLRGLVHRRWLFGISEPSTVWVTWDHCFLHVSGKLKSQLSRKGHEESCRRHGVIELRLLADVCIHSSILSIAAMRRYVRNISTLSTFSWWKKSRLQSSKMAYQLHPRPFINELHIMKMRCTWCTKNYVLEPSGGAETFWLLQWTLRVWPVT